MELLDLYSQISLGEDTRNQFKEEITNGNSLASEIVAFSNSKGGRIYVGINDKTHEIVGLSTEGIGRLNQLISNVSSQMVHPSVNPDTEIIGTPEGKKVVVITVPEGLSKPYSDNNGVFWVKAGVKNFVRIVMRPIPAVQYPMTSRPKPLSFINRGIATVRM